MTLRITLKPGEPVFIGDAVLRVATGNTCVVLIDGDAPVLRAEDFFDSPHPGTPVEAIRLLLQDLYLSRRAEAAFEQFRALAGPLLAQQPGLAPLVEKLEALLSEGQLYRAVKEAKRTALGVGGRRADLGHEPVVPDLQPVHG